MKNGVKWMVLNKNGTYAGVLCETWEETQEMLTQDPERTAYILDLNECDVTHSKNGYM